jgi:hypothetical protein
VPGSKVLHAGDTCERWGYFDQEGLRALGVKADLRGKMPDVVLCYPPKNWLLFVEAVTSHGPVDGKRRDELAKLFSRSIACLLYVSAFLTRAELTRYLGIISWETEVWVAETPTHMIHFNGARLLGPYGRFAS